MGYMKDVTGRRLDTIDVPARTEVASEETIRAVTGVARPEEAGLTAVRAIPNLKWLFTPVSGFFSDTAGTTRQTTNGGTVRCWKDDSGNADHATDSTGLTLAEGVGSGASGLNIAASARRLRTTGQFDSSFDAGFTYFVVAHDPTLNTNRVIVSSNDGRWYHNRNGTSQTMGPVWTAAGSQPTPTIPVDIPSNANTDPIPGNTMVEAVRYNGPSTKTDYWFDQYFGQGPTSSATALALTGTLCIGGLTASFPWNGQILAVAVFNRALASDEIAIVQDYLALVTSSEARAMLNCIGNSLTAGTGSSTGNSFIPGAGQQGYASFSGRDYPSQLMHEFPYRDVTIRVDAYGGRRGDQLLTELPRSTMARFTPSAHSRRVAVVWEITNSVTQNLQFGAGDDYTAAIDGTAPPSYTEMVSVCQMLRDQGWIVGVVTCLPRGDMSAANTAKFYRVYQAINALIRANYPTFASFLVDVAADPRLGQPGCELDTTYFHTDKIHLVDAGYQAVKDLIVAGVRPFLPKVSPRATISKSVAGSADVTLKSAEFATVTGRPGDGYVAFTGALTGNINVILPLITGARATFSNATSGAFGLTVKSSTGTGVAITQGKRVSLMCDGTNWVAVTAEV